MKQKKKNAAFTLIELMVVLALIGVVGGILTYNLKGSMDKGKAFRTQEAKKQIKHILTLTSFEEDLPLEEIVQNWEEHVLRSPLVSEGKKLLKDGWNEKFEVLLEDDSLFILSKGLRKYYLKHKIQADSDDEPFL